MGGLTLGTLVAVRVVYVLLGSRVDPSFAHPVLDGAYYLEWARDLISGGAGVEGAYYLAPLYPYLLAGFLKVAGESFVLLFSLQQLLTVATAWMIRGIAARAGGPGAGWCAASLVLLYHPLLFFASRPVGEAVVVFLLVAGVRISSGPGALGQGVAGLLLGGASLGKPNLLAVPMLRLLGDLVCRRLRGALMLLAGVLFALTPALVRNYAASGRLVPVASNAGMTLYHGNGPEATGLYTLPKGFSGALSSQRADAMAAARARSGRDLDPVEADRWWGREALRQRLRDPLGTARLLGWRVLLLLDNHEHGLDESPALDRNPLRFAAPVPFAVLLGLAVAGFVLAGWRGTGGWGVWGTILGSAAGPLLFFVSSRYRLPMSVLLAVPAGVGLSRLARTWGRFPNLGFGERFGCALGAKLSPKPGFGKRPPGLAAWAGLLACAGSLLVPSGRLVEAELPTLLLNRAMVWKGAGDLESAERDTRRAVELRPSFPTAHFNLGVILEQSGRSGEAEASYRRALQTDPALVEAAGNLGGLLIRRGAEAEAIPILRDALSRRPGHPVCWVNLIVALVASGDLAEARGEAARAREAGIVLAPGLLETLHGGAEIVDD